MRLLRLGSGGLNVFADLTQVPHLKLLDLVLRVGVPDVEMRVV